MGKQMTIFDFLEVNEPDYIEWCDRCVYNNNGCCGYDEPLGRYCVEGDAFEDVLYININDLVVIHNMTTKNMLLLIERETGFNFKWDDKFNAHGLRTHSTSQNCMVEIMIDLDRYGFDSDGDWFMSFDFQFKTKDHYGGGRCCDTLFEVINDIKQMTGGRKP